MRLIYLRFLYTVTTSVGVLPVVKRIAIVRVVRYAGIVPRRVVLIRPSSLVKIADTKVLLVRLRRDFLGPGHQALIA